MQLVSIRKSARVKGKCHSKNFKKSIQESRLQEKIAKVLNATSDKIECNGPGNAISEENNKKAGDRDRMVELMKEKIEISPRRTRFQVLTMTPSSWSVRKTVEVFDVSNYMVSTAFRLRKEKSILATPETNNGNVLPDTVQTLVKKFYCDDENS